MGHFDADLGSLWYIRLPSGQARMLCNEREYTTAVHRMEWVSNRKIRYRTLNPSPKGKPYHAREQVLLW